MPLHRAIAAAVASPGGASRAKRTVLHIEDNPAHHKLVQTILANRHDLEVLAATEGNRGIELAQRHLPDLILLDLWLVGMQGDEVLRQLKAHPRTRHIPIVMLSADATANKARLLQSGASAHLTKPFHLNELLDAVDEALGDRSGS